MKNPAVDHLLGNWGENRRSVLEALRWIILDTHPGIGDKDRFNIPFYDHFGWLCYLSCPPRVDYVNLGFCRGAELSDEHGLLLAEDRKQVRHYRVSQRDQIHEASLREIIREAILLNEWHWEQKQKAKKRGS